MASLLRRIKKLAYIRLNSQTPCLPRSAVPVNQECGGKFFTRHIQFAFGHGCDHSTYFPSILSSQNAVARQGGVYHSHFCRPFSKPRCKTRVSLIRWSAVGKARPLSQASEPIPGKASSGGKFLLRESCFLSRRPYRTAECSNIILLCRTVSTCFHGQNHPICRKCKCPMSQTHHWSQRRWRWRFRCRGPRPASGVVQFLVVRRHNTPHL